MSTAMTNLIVLCAIVLIVATVLTVFYVAATRKGGSQKPGLAKPPKAHNRRVNPKTGVISR